MLKTYKGRYEYGRLILPEYEQMPDTANIIITILDDDIAADAPTASKGELTPSQIAAQNFLTAMENIRKEDFTAEDMEAFSNLESGEYKLKIDRRTGL